MDIPPHLTLPTSADVGRSARHLKMSEVIARRLAAYIADADFPEGATLPSEAEMRERLDVGRTTLREALRLLETQGVITIKSGPGGGPVIRTPRPEDLSAGLALQLQLHHASFRSLVDARVLVEPSAASAAASGATEDELRLLGKNVEDFNASLPLDTASMLSTCEVFHRQVARASRNVVVEVFVASLLKIYGSADIGLNYDTSQQQEAAAAHERIFNALVRHDADDAGRAMADHLKEGLEHVHRRFPTLLDAPVRWV